MYLYMAFILLLQKLEKLQSILRILFVFYFKPESGCMYSASCYSLKFGSLG